jgi:endothelin-converting enzyme
VRNIRLKIGVPSVPNVHSPVALDGYYHQLILNDTNYFENVLAMRQFEKHRIFQLVGQRVESGEWTMPSSRVNMYYSRTRNEITIPAGVIRDPLFNPKYPDYFNYGALGTFIGHELSHSLDNQGRKHDATGRLSDWWSAETVKNFEVRADCFKQQYSKYTVIGPDDKQLYVNGELVLAEALAGKLLTIHLNMSIQLTT